MHAEVILAQGITKLLSYSIPSHLTDKITVGQAVSVPLRNNSVLAYIFKIHKEDSNDVTYEVKDIIDIIRDKSLFNQNIVELLEWLSHYYITPLSKIIKTIIPIGARTLKKFNLDIDQQRELYEISPVNIVSNIVLTQKQQEIYSYIIAHPKQHQLIHGITGSGKTEIYFKVIDYFFQKNKSSLFLVPEISLTYSVYDRLHHVYKDSVILLHSKLTVKEKTDAWLKIYHSQNIIVVGTRSAVFTPINNLGVIIIDEEQESSFKQENSPRYNAKAVAFKRAQIENIQIILGSATPLISTFYQAKKSYEISSLNERYENAKLPQVKIVDLKDISTFPKNLLTRELILKIKETLDKKEQVMLLYNQRGLSKFLRCGECGEAVICKRCSVTMTLHKNNELKCHYCGLSQSEITVCPHCSAPKLRAIGKGIQSLQNEISKTFPYASVQRLDSDTTSKKNILKNTLQDFKSQKIDILIGTQMIAKGHHFPEVTLVGIIDADLSLYLPDIYSTERTFDLITQVCGRSGRGSKEGAVIIQTFNPDHYAINYAAREDYLSFYNQEIQTREQTNNPPFARLIRVSMENKDPDLVENEINLLFLELETKHKDFIFFQPLPSLISKIKNNYRWHFIIKFPPTIDASNLKKDMFAVLVGNQYRSRIIYDVDPINIIL
ncbi:MAG: primosomal protein N' [Candidatus Margulisbacteria bacterium GWF2_35_9]|nr:MAG: primosomal protein N' [Candidatus Margulisbacteria bacterium GWF2_35_9]